MFPRIRLHSGLCACNIAIMSSYYALEATLRYYTPAAQRQWKEPPHVFLANMEIDNRSILKFNRTYGQICGTWEKIEGRTAYIIGTAGLREAHDKQNLLRRAWHREPAALKLMWVGGQMAELADPSEAYSRIQIEPFVTQKGIDLYAKDIWSFIRIAFLRDFLQNTTRICANGACPAPFFLVARRGQQFCGHKCAVLVNVHRF